MRTAKNKPRTRARGSVQTDVRCLSSTPAGSDVPERRTEAVAGEAALLFVALAGLELAFNLFAVDGVVPLLAARAAVEHEFRGDLIAVAVHAR